MSDVQIPEWVVTYVGQLALENEGLRRETARLAALVPAPEAPAEDEATPAVVEA